MLKPLTVWITTNWKILKRWEYHTHFTCLLRNLYAGQEATVKTGYGTTDSKLGKEYIKAVYCRSACLNYMQSTSCKMPGWMNHKQESRLPGEISITSDMQMTPPIWQKWRETEEPLNEGERGEQKSCLKTQHSKKRRSWHPVPSLHGK